jgi:hypothetical protein
MLRQLNHFWFLLSFLHLSSIEPDVAYWEVVCVGRLTKSGLVVLLLGYPHVFFLFFLRMWGRCLLLERVNDLNLTNGMVRLKTI